MALFDKLKNASRKVATQSSSKTKDLWQKYSDEINSKTFEVLSQTASRGKPYIEDDEKFKENVIDPLWLLAPLPMRLIGRERLKWDEVLFGTRDTVLLIEGETVQLHPEAGDRIFQSLKSMFVPITEDTSSDSLA
jgi:hypothetical protein